MAAIKPGLKVVITKGSDKGREAIVQEIIDKNFVKIKININGHEKERKINVKHIMPK
jgi:ribosomal protein L14E/L6E/L27E